MSYDNLKKIKKKNVPEAGLSPTAIKKVIILHTVNIF